MASIRVRTDVGTILIHWLLAATLVVAMATGLKIVGDEPAWRWLGTIDWLLPRENLWFWHVSGALGFTAVLSAYFVYMFRARLFPRAAMTSARWGQLFRSGRLRWGAVGTIVLWIGLRRFLTEIVTGIMIYLGLSGLALELHRQAVWICLVFPFVHVAGHLLQGGISQLVRVFRPTRLVVPPPPPDVLALLAHHMHLNEALRRGEEAALSPPPAAESANAPRRPILSALIAGSFVFALGFLLQWQTEGVLVVKRIDDLAASNLPVIDGDMSEPIWAATRPASVSTEDGANFANGSGQTRVEIRAVHDGDKIYFALSWEDPTRSLKHLPLVKRKGLWQIAHAADKIATEESYNQDQFSLLFSQPTTPVIGAAIHLTTSDNPGVAGGDTGRGLHYTSAGIADVWVWKAVDTMATGFLEDAHFEPPLPVSGEQRTGKQRYQGGYEDDEGNTCIAPNYVDATRNQASGPVQPVVLPADYEATAQAMGPVHESSDVSEEEGANWFLLNADATPYSAAVDAGIPDGTIIPDVLVGCQPSGDVADIVGAAHWAAGRWTLEIARALDTGSKDDIPISSGVMLWLAAFDHAATRHTHHVRPLTLELQ